MRFFQSFKISAIEMMHFPTSKLRSNCRKWTQPLDFFQTQNLSYQILQVEVKNVKSRVNINKQAQVYFT